MFLALVHEVNLYKLSLALLRARYDIERDTAILTRYWQQDKDVWQSIFDC